MIIECEQCGNHVPLTETNGNDLCLDCYLENEHMRTSNSGHYTDLEMHAVNQLVDNILCRNCGGTGWVAAAYTCHQCTGRGHHQDTDNES